MAAATDGDAQIRPVPANRPKRWLPWVVAVSVLLLLTLASFRPLVGHCGDRVIGAPGDATAGGVWTAYNYSQIPGPPWQTTTSLTGAPSGEPWWQPQFMPSLVVFTPLWIGGNLISPVCTWNLVVITGFVVTGIAVFAFLLWLTNRPDMAIIGMVAYTFSPYRTVKAGGHVAYVYAFGFPLLIATSIWLWRRPDFKRSLLAGAALALVGYTDGYYLLIGAVTFATIHLAALAHRLAFRRHGIRELVRPCAAVVVAGLVALTSLSPVVLATLSRSGQLSVALTRSSSDIVLYAARPWQFIVPSRAHPVFSDVFGEWSDRHLNGSNYGEQSLYVGWVILVGLIMAGVALAGSDRFRSQVRRPGVTVGFVGTILLVVLVAALLFSAPGTTYVGQRGFIMPSRVVYKFIKFWRVYARFFVVLHLAAVALGCLGWAWITQSLRRGARAGVSAILLGAVLFEMSVGWSPDWWSYDATPSVYRVASQQPGDILAEYPMYPTSAAPDNAFLTWQPVHGKRLFNVRQDGTDASELRRGLFGLADTQTLPTLRALGVDLVVLRRGNYPVLMEEPVPAGLELIRTFSYSQDKRRIPALQRGRWRWTAPSYDAELYRITPGPTAELAVALGANTFDPEPRGWTSFRWLGEDAELRVVRLSGEANRALMSFTLEPGLGRPRDVELRQGGRVIQRMRVDRATDITVAVSVGPPVVVHTRGRPTEIGNGDTRQITVGLSELGVRPLPAR